VQPRPRFLRGRSETVVAALALALLGVLPARLPAPPVPPPRDEPDVKEPRLRQAHRWLKGRRVVAAFAPRGDVVALSKPATGKVELRGLPGGKLLRTLKVHGLHGEKPRCLTFSPDGKLLAAAADDENVRQYAVSGKGVLDLGKAVRISISPVCCQADGKCLVTFAGELNIRRHDVVTGKPVGRDIPVGEYADAMACSPDGKRVATVHHDGAGREEVALWGVGTGKKEAVLGHFRARAFAMVFSPCGKYLAAGDEDGNIQLFDLARRTARGLKGHTEQITALAFTSDGRTLASGAHGEGYEKEDSTIRFWEVPAGKLRGKVTSPRGVWNLGWRHDDRVLYSSSLDGAVHLWDVPRAWGRGKGPSRR
jgi:WD40 repeat protein